MANSFKVLTLAIGLIIAPPLLLAPGFVQPAQASMADAAGELAYWNRIKNSSSAADFKAYLDAYPNGMFSDLALSKYHSLSGATKASAPKTQQTKHAAKRAKARHLVAHKAHKHIVHKKRIKRKIQASTTDPFPNVPSHGGGNSGGGGGWGH